eukprot:7265820-Pyramimonas_sp.AAC.1
MEPIGRRTRGYILTTDQLVTARQVYGALSWDGTGEWWSHPFPVGLPNPNAKVSGRAPHGH